MYRLRTRYAIVMRERVVDFRVTPVPRIAKQPPQHQVEVTVHGTDDLHGRDLCIRLLDHSFRPLRVATEGLDFIRLPVMRWLGVASCHKAQRFEATGPRSGPAYLFLELDGMRFIGQLTGNGDDDGGKKKDDAKKDGPQKEEAKDGGKAAAGAGAGRAAGGGAATCCADMKNFQTPPGPLASTWAVALPPQGGPPTGLKIMAPFNVSATFNAAPAPCDCAFCEYLQFVKGHMWLQFADGSTKDMSPTMRYQEFVGPLAPGTPRPLVENSTYGLNDKGFVEDTVGDNTKPGAVKQTPGHRDDPTAIGKYTNCSFTFADTPSTELVPIGSTVDVNVTFFGRIVDKRDRSTAILTSNTWTWTFQKQLNLVMGPGNSGSIQMADKTISPKDQPGR